MSGISIRNSSESDGQRGGGSGREKEVAVKTLSAVMWLIRIARDKVVV